MTYMLGGQHQRITGPPFSPASWIPQSAEMKLVFALCTSSGTTMVRSYIYPSPRITWRKLRNTFCKKSWSFRGTVFLCQPMHYGQFMLVVMVLKTSSEWKPFACLPRICFMFFLHMRCFCNSPSYVVPFLRLILYRTISSDRVPNQTASFVVHT